MIIKSYIVKSLLKILQNFAKYDKHCSNFSRLIHRKVQLPYSSREALFVLWNKSKEGLFFKLICMRKQILEDINENWKSIVILIVS